MKQQEIEESSLVLVGAVPLEEAGARLWKGMVMKCSEEKKNAIIQKPMTGKL